MTVPVTAYIVLAGVLFSLGALTVLLRRNAIIELMGVELMLNAVNLVLVTFSRIHGNLTGQVFAFFVMVVAAAEVVVGLSIVVSIFRTRRSTSVDDENLLKNRGAAAHDRIVSRARRRHRAWRRRSDAPGRPRHGSGIHGLAADRRARGRRRHPPAGRARQ